MDGRARPETLVTRDADREDRFPTLDDEGLQELPRAMVALEAEAPKGAPADPYAAARGSGHKSAGGAKSAEPARVGEAGAPAAVSVD
jgi:ribosomal protein L4